MVAPGDLIEVTTILLHAPVGIGQAFVFKMVLKGRFGNPSPQAGSFGMGQNLNGIDGFVRFDTDHDFDVTAVAFRGQSP